MRNIYLIILLALTLSSCRTSKPVTKPEIIQPPSEIVVEKIVGIELSGTWALQKLWGSENKWVKPPEIDIDFNDKTFTGNTGCNSISGKFAIDGNYLAFAKEILTTKVACPGYNEKRLLAVLLKINRYAVDNNVLELSQDDIVLMKFIKK
ncbi:MAG: META domain-containing protein [Ginsengibacter sp.]